MLKSLNKIPTILENIIKSKDSKPLRESIRMSGINIPKLVPPFIIAEIKRASPTKAHINDIKEPVSFVEEYLRGGADAISILCEEDYFKGSLDDLAQVRSAYPKALLLRKDFITKRAQITESVQFGADVVLLIAALFREFIDLKELYEVTLEAGLTPLIEVHTEDEVDFIAPLNARLIGVNSRNLHNFKIDKIYACNLLTKIRRTNKDAFVIFESSINCSFEGFLVGNVGFDGILCGTYFLSSSTPSFAIARLKASMQKGREASNFYKNVFKLLCNKYGFIKICGITNVLDAQNIAKLFKKYLCTGPKIDAQYELENALDSKDNMKLGALGFIMVRDSKRFIDEERIKEIVKAQGLESMLKIAIIKNGDGELPKAIRLYKEGYIDAIQLHGARGRYFDEVDLLDVDFSFYEAWNVESEEDLGEVILPFVLLDSKSKVGGGSGKEIDIEVLKKISKKYPYIGVGGGVGAKNIPILKELGIKMLDINSSVESSPGKKDMAKVEEVLKILKNL